MTKQDIVDYVMETPLNTNPAILGQMIDEISQGGGGGSSEFNTAEVTLIGIEGSSFGLDPRDDTSIFVKDEEFIRAPVTDGSGESTTFILYYFGDSCVTYPDNTYDSSTGNVVYNEKAGTLTITGDCTITGWVAD